MEIVAADIGGTNARFAIATIDDDGRVTLGAPVTLPTAGHASLPLAWAAFGAAIGRPLPPRAGIAIAAPVRGDTLKLTNNNWVMRPATLAGELGVDALTLINDFGAVGHAVAHAGPDHLLHIAGPDRPLPADGVISIVGPGTGLGVAYVVRRASRQWIVETEGGHVDFAPLDPLEEAILARLRKQHRRVSTERICAGPGLAQIHATIADMEGSAVRPRDDKALWTAALDGSDPLAAAALDRFCLSLGSVAGDIALAQGASALVIAGGLGARLRDHLPRSGFASRFVAKGRYEAMMAAMPIKLITHAQPGLLGAAMAFVEQHGHAA
ncbi:glucokinase [Sphingomonas laterariae]|uniref:Glucokinase n=1 Tax=Edaphosphingomonas laterariae TaxID=861865 RepID=A0A239FJZ8_9SPHN|nr:glucokinase [Sphingomonas laterariae]SNS57125.1 glucokinase [Sphingomonas laterariae]